jgi:cytochrome c-type biogenesis protein CcmE
VSPLPRLVIALSVAATLSVFLLYTALAGGATTTLTPTTIIGHDERVALTGVAEGPIVRTSSGLLFRIRDLNGSRSIPVSYHGTVPDLFQPGREVIVTGRLSGSRFVARQDSLVTRCPSKYTAASKNH